MQLGLAGKVVLITGASRGLGEAMAYEFAAEGAKVAICARSGDRLDAVAAEIRARHSSEVLALPADLSRLGDHARVARETKARFGRVDVLVNNAGAIQSGSLTARSDADVLGDWTLKLFGYVRMARQIFPLMVEQKDGRIINIAGSTGTEPGFGNRTGESFAGGMANSALMNFTKSLSYAGAPHGILVNCISPGHYIRTTRALRGLAKRSRETGEPLEDLVEAWDKTLLLGRAGEPADIAAMAVFLASRRASYITGAVMRIDGGNSLSY